MPNALKKLLELLKTPLGLAAIAAILAFTPLTIVSFLLVLFITAKFVPFKVGVITRLALSFCLVICVFGFIAAVAWIVGTALSSTIILLLLLAPSATIAFLNRNEPSQNTTFGADSHELLAAGLSLAAVIFIALPVLQAPSISTLVRTLSSGGDNSSHITMVKVSDLNQGLAYGLDNRVDPIPGAVSYPHTWHFSVAFFKWLLEPIVSFDSPKVSLVVFYGSSVLWFGLLVFFMTQCALRVAMFVTKKRNAMATTMAILVCAGVTIHWLIQLFTNGFQSQIASLLMIMAEVYILVEAYRLAANKRYPMLLLAGLLAFGSTVMWTLLMPIALGILGLCVLQTVIANKRLPSLPVIFSFVVIGLFILFQLAIIWMFPVGFEDRESLILQRGFINPTSIEAVLVMAAIAVIAWLLHGKNQQQRVLFASLAVALGFSGALMAYQLYELGELRYFYYKSTYTAIIFAGALLGAAAYFLAFKLFGSMTKLKTGLTVAITLVAGALVLWQIKDPVAVQYVDGSLGGMSPQTAGSIMYQAVRGSQVAGNTTYMGSCNRGDDIRANLFMTAVVEDMIYKPTSFDQGGHDRNAIFEAIALHLRTRQAPISIVSNDQATTEALKVYLGDEVKNPNLEIIDLDPTPQTETIKQCPDRIRDIQKYPVQ